MSKEQINQGNNDIEAVYAEQDSSEIRLITSPKLNYLKQVLSSAEFDWDKILSTFHQSKVYRRGNYSGDNLTGILLETHLGLVLKEFASAINGVCLDPVKNGDVTRNYVFKIRKDRNRLVAINKSHGNDVAEYDGIVTLTDKESVLPVVVEAKMIKKGHFSLNSIIRVSHIAQVFRPLVERFQQSEFGYIVATSREAISFQSPIQQAFIRSGGILLELPSSYYEFKQQSQKAWPRGMH